jgi:hypothetical protein
MSYTIIYLGAIASFTSPLWSLTTNNSLYIINNTAYLGSALFFQSVIVSSNDYLHNIYFTNNSAILGGTIYWLYDKTMSHPPNGLSSPSISWSNNLAKYGHKTATQGKIKVHIYIYIFKRILLIFLYIFHLLK